MPFFLCPCCGESYLVPLAFCDELLERHLRDGSFSVISPARCLACQGSVSQGEVVGIRNGSGVRQDGDRINLPALSKATVVDVATWEGEGSIFLVRLETGEEVFVTRAQIFPDRTRNSE